MANFRKEVITNGSFYDVTLLLNNRNWIFDDIESRYTIALASISKDQNNSISIQGPYNSYSSYKKGIKNSPTLFPSEEFLKWSKDLVFPLIPSPQAGQNYRKMKKQPNFDDESMHGGQKGLVNFMLREINH